MILDKYNCWDNEAFEKKLKEKIYRERKEWLNKQIEIGLRLLGLAVIENDKQQIKLVKPDLKRLIKEFETMKKPF